MKQRGREHQGTEYPGSTLPVGMIFFRFFFISCVVIHNNMTLKPLIWWKYFEFFPENKKKILSGHWNVPGIQQHSVGLDVHWKVNEQCFQWTFREHSVDIQKCFSRLKGEFSSCGTYRLYRYLMFSCLGYFCVILQYTLDIVLVHTARFEILFILSKLLKQVLNR